MLPERNKKIKKWTLRILGMLLLFPILLFLLVYLGVFGKLYSKEELKNIQNYLATEVYSEDKKILGNYYWENRSITDYKHIPHFLIESLIATEDARFYEHNGVDAKGLFRVFFKTLLMGDKNSGGGSTIGQQLAKNLFKRPNYGFLTMPVNKIKEAIHAVRFNSVYTQNEILALYLNTVSVGEDTYGIKNAALRFFSKPPDSLTIEEGAVLIGMLKSPTTYNPRLHPENSLARRNSVINNLVKHGYISTEKADSIKKIPLTIRYKNTGMYGNIAPYFLIQIEQLATAILDTLKTSDEKKYNLYTDGLKIYTTLDYQMQEYAVAAMQKHMRHLQKLFDKQWKHSNPWRKKSTVINTAVKKSKRYNALVKAGIKEDEIDKNFKSPLAMEVFDWEGGHTADLSPIDSIKYYAKILHNGFLAMEPFTGAIKAWVGGNDYNYFQYDHVRSKRQVGSTFKPIVYATAIEQGMSPCDYIKNEQQVYDQFENWAPENADKEYGGKYSIKGALENSVNVVSVEVLFKAGIDNTINTARKMGIESDIPAVPSIALGVADISLLEMVKAYCAFPNGGRSVEPRFITRIEDKYGKVIYKAKNTYKSKQVFSKQTAYYMTEMLKGVIDQGTASRIRSTYGLSGEMAGKTGTTQSQADGWFIGYTSGLVAGSWVGAESPSIHFNSTLYGQGASMALPIWAYFIKKCKNDPDHKKYVNGKFNVGDNLVRMPECASYRDNIFDRIGNWFNNDKTKSKKEKETEQEERKKRRFKFFRN
ncbi:MAG: transglycosylase domain-containing protein [Bacteroidota bacterium]